MGLLERGGDGGGDCVKETVVVHAAFASGVFESSDKRCNCC